MTELIKTLIVEDEIAGIDHLTRLIEEDKRLKLVGVVKSVKDARLALKKYDAGLMFLDVNLRGGSGFELVEDFPAICTVVTTAHSDFAGAAFDVNAIDFLLKPFSPMRFRQAIEKVVSARRQSREKLFLRTAAKNGSAVLNLTDISYLRAEGKSTAVICGEKKFTVSQLLGEIEKKLPAQDFIRIHRQYIVQKSLIETVNQNDRQLTLALRGHSDKLPVGKTFVSALKKILK